MFGWVKSELWEYIKRIENCANRIRSGAEVSTLSVVSDSLHKIYGILKILDLNAACLFVEDMELLNQRIESHDEFDNVDQMLTCFTIGLGELKTYLYAIEREKPQSPLVLTQPINRIRQLTSRTQLSFYDLFHPTLELGFTRSQEKPLSLTDSERINLLFHLRQRFRQSLLHWLSNNNQLGMLANISEILGQLERISRLDVLQQLWWIAREFVDVIKHGKLKITNEVRAQFANLDVEITRMKDESHASIKGSPPLELFRQMLFYIGSGMGEEQSQASLLYEQS